MPRCRHLFAALANRVRRRRRQRVPPRTVVDVPARSPSPCRPVGEQRRRSSRSTSTTSGIRASSAAATPADIPVRVNMLTPRILELHHVDLAPISDHRLGSLTRLHQCPQLRQPLQPPKPTESPAPCAQRLRTPDTQSPDCTERRSHPGVSLVSRYATHPGSDTTVHDSIRAQLPARSCSPRYPAVANRSSHRARRRTDDVTSYIGLFQFCHFIFQRTDLLSLDR